MCTLQWSLRGHQHVCISYSQEDIKRQLKKTSYGRSSQLNQYLSNKTLSVSKILCVLQMVLLTKILNIDVGTGAHNKDRKSTRGKANIGNPKVNSLLTANRTLADCVENSLGPSEQYIPLGVYHNGGLNAMKNSIDRFYPRVPFNSKTFFCHSKHIHNC